MKIDRDKIESALLDGLHDTPHGWKYSPSTGYDALAELLVADPAEIIDLGLRAYRITKMLEDAVNGADDVSLASMLRAANPDADDDDDHEKKFWDEMGPQP